MLSRYWLICGGFVCGWRVGYDEVEGFSVLSHVLPYLGWSLKCCGRGVFRVASWFALFGVVIDVGERVCYDVGFWMLVCAGLWGSRGVFLFFLFVFGFFFQLTRGLFIWDGYRSRCACGLVVVVMGVAQRGLKAQVTMTYKIANGLVCIQPTQLIPSNYSTRSQSKGGFRQLATTSNFYKC